MQRWEYATLESRGSYDIRINFSHGPSWAKVGYKEYWTVLKRLGDEGWEMVCASGIDASLLHFKRPYSD